MTREHDAYQLVHVLLAEAEQQEMACSDELDQDEHQSHLQRIEHLLSALDKQVTVYHHRYERLVARSRMEQVKWAQELLDLPHFALLDLYCDPADPTGRRCQVVAIDSTGAILFEAVFTSFGVVSGPTNDVRPLAEGTRALMETLDGCFLGMSETRSIFQQLHMMTKRARIDQPTLAGTSLFEAFQTYFQAQHPDYEALFQLDETMVLAQLSERIEQPRDTPTRERPSAKGRAHAMLCVLRAIAQGFVDPKTTMTFLRQDAPHSAEQGTYREDENGRNEL
jgi:hypothetical protein